MGARQCRAKVGFVPHNRPSPSLHHAKKADRQARLSPNHPRLPSPPVVILIIIVIRGVRQVEEAVGVDLFFAPVVVVTGQAEGL